MTQRIALRDIFFLFAAACLALLPLTGQAQSTVPRAPSVEARSYILMDARSGHIIVQHNADQTMPPASLTKMMTAYIAEREIQSGNISLQDQAPVSVKAWRMGGSRTFLKEGTQVSIDDLLRGIIIQSGNDASVAMAEYIAGSEDAFADLMNQQARALNMNDTHFMNATGWPAENHHSTAHDMARLARAIINDYPEHYDIYAEKEFTYNGITQTNRNLLLWRDSTVDGLKTGHTDEAGYCLVASAKRDEMRLISVVMGTASEQARAQETQKLLTYGFRFFESYKAYSANDVLANPDVWLGAADTVRLGPEKDVQLTVPRDSADRLQAEMTINPQLRAPIEKGQQYGTVTIRLDDEVISETPLVALESVEEGGFFSRLWDHIMLFFKGLF
ncbi:D-alanyl-D-alanine carboxypeptidase family protein [Alloalcanivorax xenomutans]|jgi:serine-type D-Ala-D-Ala carboxypeptidase (penicillin-binding protein 5/6)|uniref:D-alanyl-D-alanine carboxypeptidase family protein n=1 Tax=Alloalcanivorax xenomutans TaxID=1094342 RepID=UPI0003B887E5|nr:D-alanyl-D-alanine carboxypeptidase family protein [Alloalcanivorax xenomutans]ERS12900.1 D-alanyl-D-alanine carboxypeptidase [Alcanivorax sp. PN-3]MBA4722797.1 D-alanyl-D-alanine carboxypeptidase [Alcanivorax sp.]PHS66821.1 MAG: D-alanyl-D-alanine carboxypeptidase [Alcanivorax sp.]CUR44676.1 D-alanyl-D-alanine carboxypeptidase [Alloalcanivorax xenomutans]SOC12491.1 D-alanyl-D-alanine carboxypeptidase (penicillin-binding protein 5/6) [Alloalcanivorax xenomutans]